MSETHSNTRRMQREYWLAFNPAPVGWRFRLGEFLRTCADRLDRRTTITVCMVSDPPLAELMNWPFPAFRNTTNEAELTA